MMQQRLYLLLSFLLCLGLQAQNFSQGVISPANPQAVFPVKHQFHTGDTLRIVTWNVEHLVDSIDDPYVNNRIENSAQVKVEKMQLLARGLATLNADVVVLQEAESANAVQALRDAYFPDLGYQYITDARSRNWYQNVVIMSKLPLGEITSYGNVHTPVIFTEDGEDKFQSQEYINTRMWSCEVLVNDDYYLNITGLHLKAGRKDRDIAMRLGQIRFLKSALEKQVAANKKTKLLVLGDLNSLTNSEEISTLLNFGSKKVRLFDPLDHTVFTHPADQPSRRLDYILYNKNLAQDIIPQSCRVGQLFSPEEMRIISDHLPLQIDILCNKN
jgi:endonuclease/exonuclease/phosphatase family metal-dependent hydrolase